MKVILIMIRDILENMVATENGELKRVLVDDINQAEKEIKELILKKVKELFKSFN